MKYKYSIIIPHFNDFDNLKTLLKSIPKRDDIEIIIVDDYSNNPFDLASLKNINTFSFIKNTGVKSAGTCRNIGLSVAEGKWLLFADSDDFFVANAFYILDESVDCKCDLIYFSPTSVDSETGLISDRHIAYKRLVESFLSSGNNRINYYFYVPWSKLILNSFIRSNSIQFEEVLASNDVMFSLKVGFNAKHIKAIEKEIYCVTKRKGSLISSFNKEVLRSRYNVSLRRNNALFQKGLKIYQEPIYILLKKYHKIINVADIWALFNIFLMGKVNLFPITYVMYFKKPSTLYMRLFRK